MNDATEFLRQNAGPPALVFTDYESELILGHYLCHQKAIAFETSSADFEVFSCDGVRVISTSYKTATLFDANSFVKLWNKLTQDELLRDDRLTLGQSVWIFQAGWKVDLAEDLRNRFPEFQDLSVKSFGNNIRMFQADSWASDARQHGERSLFS